MQVLGLVQQVRSPAQGLNAGGLSHAAHPGWRAAAEVEQVLPGDEAAAPGHTERVHLVEQLAQGVRIAFRLVPHAEAVQGVGLLEGGQRMDLKTLAGEVLEQDLAAPEAHLVPGRRVGQAAPVLAVALDLQEGRRHPRGAEQAPERERLDRVHHVAQLGVARAGERPQCAHAADVPAPPAPPVAGRDGVLADGPPQRAVDRAAGPACCRWRREPVSRRGRFGPRAPGCGRRRRRPVREGRARPRARPARSRRGWARRGRQPAGRSCRRRRSRGPRRRPRR